MPPTRLAFGCMLALEMIPYTAYCETFATPENAAKAFFPGRKFDKVTLTLTDDDVKKIEAASGEKVRERSLNAWVTAKKEVMLIDQVLGKHEFITYAVGISPDGKVAGVEILEYRETYGQKVAEEKWRKQFVGKDVRSPIKVNADIINISGATLSSAHISAGVRRLVQSHDIVKSRF